MTDFFQFTNHNGGHENKEKLIVYIYLKIQFCVYSKNIVFFVNKKHNKQNQPFNFSTILDFRTLIKTHNRAYMVKILLLLFKLNLRSLP